MKLENIVSYAKRISGSRIGWLLAALHALWFVLAIANMSTPDPALARFLEQGGLSSATVLAGRPFHFHYESLALKLLFFFDIPAIVVGAILALIPSLLFSNTIHISFFAASYASAVIMLLAGSVQWLVIGSSVENWFNSGAMGKIFVRRCQRYFIPLVIGIVLSGSVLAPIVNNRSKQLGFRHPGISFVGR